MTRSYWLEVVTQFLHLSVREGMMLTPGQVLDLQLMERLRRGLIKKER